LFLFTITGIAALLSVIAALVHLDVIGLIVSGIVLAGSLSLILGLRRRLGLGRADNW
jgi:hypothetical protein